jgi:hypothetical protein
MSAYSAVPLRVKDFDAAQIEQYKYVVNILSNKIPISTTQPYQFEGYVFTRVNFATPHKFKLGDIVFLNQASGFYTDYYTIITIPSSTSIVVDLTLGQPLTGATTVANAIKYKLTPDPDGDAKLDLSNTLKDYVTQNLEDSNNIFDGVNTRFDYELLIGYEGKALYQFDDNYFVNGNVGFLATGLTATTQVDFEIGDEIIIQQNLYEWPYTDNFFFTGNLGFTGTTANIFSIGDSVTITGQITEPYYNGDATVTSAGTNFIVVNKGFTTSTPVEGGTIYGVPVPEYNTTAIITNIVFSAGIGVIIVTDQGFVQSTPPIGGTIRHADGKLITSFNQLSITGLSVFNSYIPQTDYSITAFDPYVVQSRANNLNYLSTIYDIEASGLRYRIQPETKSWLLAHTDDSSFWEPVFSFYNSSNTLLSRTKLTFPLTYGPQVNINTYANNGGNLQLNLFSVHNLLAGDKIQIFNSHPSYNGVTTVLTVLSTTAIVVDVSHVTNSVLGSENIKKVTGGIYEDYYFPIGIDQIAESSNNVLLTGSALSAISSSVDYYKVELYYEGSANTNSIYFEMNDDCSKFETYHLLWKDAKGSWISYPFKYLSQDRMDVDRKNYYQTEGTWENGTFGYDSYGRGETTFFARSRNKITLNSGWIDEYENELIRDLMQSAKVYIQTPDNKIMACVIDDKNITFGKDINDQIYQYKFEVTFSNNNIRL